MPLNILCTGGVSYALNISLLISQLFGGLVVRVWSKYTLYRSPPPILIPFPPHTVGQPSSLMGANPLQGPLVGVDPENLDFLGPEILTSERQVHKITNVHVFLWRLGPDFLGPKWQSLFPLPFQGLKKYQFSGPTSSNDPCNGFVLIKIITPRAL